MKVRTDYDTTLSVGDALKDKRLVVIGATGFLGKVWLSLLLHRYPEIGHVYLLVRPKKDLDEVMRFWTEVAPSPVFDPLREKHPGHEYEQFLKDKITPVAGDVQHELLGIREDVLTRMKDADAVVNAAGVVDFNPPLDDALNVNAFGVQNLIELARFLGDLPVLHTSTCYVVGNRSDMVLERDPRKFPFPRADELEPSLWDAEREIEECIDLVAQARSRCDDRFRQSHFLDVAKRNLEKNNEPPMGEALEDELARVRRKFIEKQLMDAGLERAKFWGWPNTYTYTKSIGEQVLLSSGLRTTIVRPAIIESALEYPSTGWCEGINTSAPLIYMAMKGHVQYVMNPKTSIDIIPVDLVAMGMVGALGALLTNEHQPVYQLGTSDTNALLLPRLVELVGIAKRRRYKSKGDGNPLLNLLQSHIEPVVVDKKTFYRQGSPGLANAAKQASGLLGKLKKTPLGFAAAPAAKVLGGFAKTEGKLAEIFEIFLPFTWDNEFRFSCKNTRSLFGRLSESDKEKIWWNPDELDWRHYFLDVHVPGLHKWVDPVIEERRRRETRPRRRHDNLVALAEGMATRHEWSVAFSRLEGEQLSRITYLDVWERAGAVAARLAEMGVSKGDRVAIAGKNHPAWPIAYFGIMRAGGTAVPFDPAMEVEGVENILKSSKAVVALFDDTVERPEHTCPVLDLIEVTDRDDSLEPPEVDIHPGDVASLIYTSGTTGKPKGVMLTHENFTALLASLSPLFKIGRRDRVLSVLPLHHTFEFTCGMLLPFSHGSRLIYLDELTGERLVTALTVGKVTAMVGVPALWQLLERRIRAQVKERGVVAETAFRLLGRANRGIGRQLGVDLGKVFFREVHSGLGGNLRLLISGGAALPSSTQELFGSLGLHLAEGYGLTEASPVLTVALPSPRNKPGQVGRPIPGVEVRIFNPDDEGVGEVIARGPNVMKGYEDDEATAEVIKDGWLRTGDLGRFDKKGRLVIVGRSKDVIVSSTGENVYPDDIEERLGDVEHVSELSIVGVPDPRGGERVACLAVPSDDRGKARAALKQACEALPRHMRPTLTHFIDSDLPRTATRKVKRPEVRKILERLHQASSAADDRSVSASDAIAATIAAVADMKPSEIKTTHHLADDLGFDSLMLVELSAALQSYCPDLAPEDLANCETVADVEARVGQVKNAPRRKKAESEDAERTDIEVPDAVKKLGKRLLRMGQKRLYSDVLDTRVSGQANIPHNRNTIVIANHTSHLDMGLVKHALGGYGEDIVAMAAQDYFFEDRWRRAYFKNFTNMAALDRKRGLRKSLQQAGELLGEGKTLLIFPEGTRSPDGVMRDFKPAIGTLALDNGVDLLPVYVYGTHGVLAKGSKIPKGRKIGARIGPPLKVSDLRRLTRHLNKPSDRYREVARLAQSAVEALRNNEVLDLAQIATPEGEHEAPVVPKKLTNGNPLAGLFGELEGRFVQGAVNEPVSFYFKLGEQPNDKWTVAVGADFCTISTGKPDGGRADCVLKTNHEMFMRIVRESYIPKVGDFMSGKVKTNDIEMLKKFQRIFDL